MTSSPRRRGPLAAVSLALLITMAVAVTGVGLAVAEAPGAVTQPATDITATSATLNGTVSPNREDTTYYFQYGTTSALGTETALTPVGAGDRAVRVSVDLAGLAPTTRYHYRIVAQNASGTTLGKRRTFTTRRQPLGVSLAATPNPIKLGSGTTLAGTVRRAPDGRPSGGSRPPAPRARAGRGGRSRGSCPARRCG